MITKRSLAAIGFSTLVLAGCTRDQPQPAAVAQPAPGAAVTVAPTPAPSDGSATVIETMRSGGYTYAKIQRGSEQVWAAGPETELAVGTKLGAIDGMVMTDFHSNTLNRTFDRIYFLSSWPIPGGAHTADPHAADPHATAEDPPAPPAAIEKIAPPTGGKTIAQVFGGKDALTGKSVVVRGKVTKFNAGILGRNWIHLQDGTGTAGSNDLTVTTATTAAPVTVGDVVVARGTVALNKDFGGGYSYPVIVEDAAITK